MALETNVLDAPNEAVDLFKQFVKYDSAKRISAKEALKHRYFSISPLAASLDKMPKPSFERGLKIKTYHSLVNK